MKDFLRLFLLYKKIGYQKALWVLTRLFILPSGNLNKSVPREGVIVDIGCGRGGLTNFLALKSDKRKLIGVDLSKRRISDAQKTVNGNRNVKFVLGDIVSTDIPRAKAFLLVDVLHHISFNEQENLLKNISRVLTRGSFLIIKEVDKSNTIPFLFGHLIEKILYPRERIFVRTRSDWIKLLHHLGLKFKIWQGAFYFPDSTLIFVCRKK